jgi:molecular chaperone DnaJ
MSAKRCYYEVLGVERCAAHDQIKKAYKKLARELHPDRNPNDPTAEERFKEASEAFQVLSDGQKRQIYDRFGHAGLDRSGYQGFHDVQDVFGSLGDIFADLFGGFGGFATAGRRPRRGDRPMRGADIQAGIQLTLVEAAFGCKKELELAHPVPCEECGGSGAHGGQRRTCETCGGQGQVAHSRGMFVLSTTCRVCMGEGSVIADPCRKCGGRGQVDVHRKISITVPAGVDAGQTMRLNAQGQPGRSGGPTGHLFIVVDVAPHEQFQRDGADLIHEARIPYPTAVLGGEVEVPVLDPEPKTTPLRIPAGTQSGEQLVVKGGGVPRLDGRGRGDLVVVLEVDVPTEISPRARELLGELATELLQKPAAPRKKRRAR